MTYTATRLRQNLYNILDSVAETGVPVLVERNGRTLKIIADTKPNLWDRVEKRNITVGDPEELVSREWSGEWTGEPEL